MEKVLEKDYSNIVGLVITLLLAMVFGSLSYATHGSEKKSVVVVMLIAALFFLAFAAYCYGCHLKTRKLDGEVEEILARKKAVPDEMLKTLNYLGGKSVYDINFELLLDLLVKWEGHYTSELTIAVRKLLGRNLEQCHYCAYHRQWVGIPWNNLYKFWGRVFQDISLQNATGLWKNPKDPADFPLTVAMISIAIENLQSVDDLLQIANWANQLEWKAHSDFLAQFGEHIISHSSEFKGLSVENQARIFRAIPPDVLNALNLKHPSVLGEFVVIKA